MRVSRFPPGKLTQRQLRFLNVLKLSGCGFFSEVEEATGLNPKSVTKALDALIRIPKDHPRITRIVKLTFKGGLGKALATTLREGFDPEEWEEDDMKALAGKLEQTTAGRPLYILAGLMTPIWVDREMESDMQQGWVVRNGGPMNPVYDLTSAGREHFGLTNQH